MAQHIAEVRKLGAHDFVAYYEHSCMRNQTVPLLAIKVNIDKGMLDFNGDRLKVTDWPPILNSISINKCLHHIAISSTFQANVSSEETDRRYYKSAFKRKIPVICSKDMTFKLCKALKECLTISPNLKTLHLQGLQLRDRDLITLTRGLEKSASLESLSLANCPISDEGLEVICQSVKYSSNIRIVDFTGCSLTWRGAEHMANIIKHQALQRHSTAWVQSLRYRTPQFEGMGGLRRVTLNANSLIGDRGASALARELAEDLWVKAVDLQKCGLSNAGACHLLEALKTNTSLCVLDIRNNPLVDKALIKTILEKVLMNPHGQPLEYCWIKNPKAEPLKASDPKKRSQSSQVKSTFRKAPHKGPPRLRGQVASAAHARNSCSSTFYDRRRAGVQAGHQGSLCSAVSVSDQYSQGATTVKVTIESEEEEEEKDEEYLVEVEPRPYSFGVQDRTTWQQTEVVQMELKECRRRLSEEHRARLIAQSRIMELELENARLCDANTSLSEALTATGFKSAPAAVSVLEDEAVLESIESSFTKFHAFLDLLRDAGFGHLASMAGIDHCHFKPLRRPQFSSTIGAQADDAASQTEEEHMDVWAKIRDAPLNISNLPADTAEQEGSIATSQSSPSIGVSTNEDLPYDETPNEASGRVADTGVCGDEEPRRYVKPDTWRDSGSDHSGYSQISFEKTFQTQKSNSKSNSSSRRSNRSYENGLKNIHSYKDVSHSHTHGTSIKNGSDISDRAASVGSAGSWSRGKQRLVTVSHSERIAAEQNYARAGHSGAFQPFAGFGSSV